MGLRRRQGCSEPRSQSRFLSALRHFCHDRSRSKPILQEALMSLIIPLGFRFAGLHAGIKKSPGKEDLTLVHCERGAVAAGTYTTNLVHAAPVVLDRGRTPSSDIRVVIVNSGNANAC